MKARKQKIEFTINLHTEFGIGSDVRKAHKGETPEETFKNIWNSLPKRHDKNWFLISFEQDGKEFEIDRQLFRENRFDFNLTIENNQ